MFGKQHSEETKLKMSESHWDCSGENNPNYGKSLTEEHKRRISKANKGKKHSEETREKMSKAHKGKKGKQHSEETKKKISEANKGNDYFKGKQHSEETKLKMSENHANVNGENNPNAKKIILLNTKEIFLTIKEGSEKYNCNKGCVSQCCKGKRKSAGKHPITNEPLVWMYYEDYLKLIKEMEI